MSFFKNEKGQVAVEYILILVAVVAIASTVLPRFREFLVGKSTDCAEDNNAYICRMLSVLDDDNRFLYWNL